MSAFLTAVKATTLDMALYFVGDWRKVGAAEAFLASLRESHAAGTFADMVIPFEPNEKSQAQYNAAATALRRLTLGYVKNARSTDPAKPPVTIEGRYPEFVVRPLSYNEPTTYPFTIKVKGKNVTKNRNARKGILVKLSAATVAAEIEASK